MNTAKEISESVKFKNDIEKIDFINDTIQLEILHKFIENTEYKKIDIAKRLKVSESFVSQLFSGDKRLSFKHLAALVFYFNLDLKIDLNLRDQCKIVNFRDAWRYEDHPCFSGDKFEYRPSSKDIEGGKPKTLCV